MQEKQKILIFIKQSLLHQIPESDSLDLPFVLLDLNPQESLHNPFQDIHREHIKPFHVSMYNKYNDGVVFFFSVVHVRQFVADYAHHTYFYSGMAF